MTEPKSAQLGLNFSLRLVPKSVSIGSTTVDIPPELLNGLSKACVTAASTIGGAVVEGGTAVGSAVKGGAKAGASLGLKTMGAIVELKPNDIPEPLRNYLFNLMFANFVERPDHYGPDAKKPESRDFMPKSNGSDSVSLPLSKALSYTGIVELPGEWNLGVSYDPSSYRPNGVGIEFKTPVK